MRVTFIIPPSGFLLDDRVFPALGVLKVASVLEAAGIEVRVLDLCGETRVRELVDEHLAAYPSDVYGITDAADARGGQYRRADSQHLSQRQVIARRSARHAHECVGAAGTQAGPAQPGGAGD
jgi:hypothetical protein